MNFREAISGVFKVITFQRRTIANIARDLDATVFALFWIALGGVFNVMHSQLTRGVEASQYLTSPVLLIIVTAIVVAVLHTIARLLGGSGSFLSMMRVFGFALPITWILLLPFGSKGLLLVTIWLILVSIHLIAVVHQLSFGRATLTIMIPLLVTVGGIVGIVNFLGESILAKFF